LAAAALFLICLALPGCGAFGSPEPNFAHAAVYIADAGNAVSAAEALLPSLNLSSDEVTQAKELIARARAALAAAAAATNGAKDLTTEQLDEISKNVVVPNVRGQLEELKELGIPSEGEDVVNELLDALDEGIKKGEEDPSAFVGEGTVLTKADKLAKEYGFKECGGGE
jgi:hypothetical protein